MIVIKKITKINLILKEDVFPFRQCLDVKRKIREIAQVASSGLQHDIISNKFFLHAPSHNLKDLYMLNKSRC